MLEFKNVDAFYGKKQVVFNANFNIHKGSIVAVLGQNGSGKTTLFSLFLNQIKYGGQILLNGEDIKEISLIHRAKQMSFLPQNLPESELTVYDLVSLGRNPYLSFNNKLTQNDINKIESAIIKTKLSDFVNTPISKLSGGERQRAYLAMILAQDTKVCIFDEPLSFLDPSFSVLFLQVIKELKENGKTVIVIMHDVNKAIDNADDILFLHNGKIEFFGTTKELIDTEIIEKYFNLTKYNVINDDVHSYIYK